MKINNSDYGGFVVSKNVISGKPIRYTFREKSEIPELNDWNIYSVVDDDEYVNNSDIFKILGASSLVSLVPIMLEIFSAPYGTNQCWLYEDGIHIGFYDLKKDNETDIPTILG